MLMEEILQYKKMPPCGMMGLIPTFFKAAASVSLLRSYVFATKS
jgi:hypothetical protein